MKKKEKKEETINNRVKMVRKALGMTQQEFAEKLGHKTSNTLSMLERGKSQLTEYNIRSICTQNQLKDGYTVSEEWLREGGDASLMFQPKPPPGRVRIYDDHGVELPRDEEEFIGIYRDLSALNKITAKKQIDALWESQGGTIEKGENSKPAGIGSGNSGETGS